jgi:hypothetical protein
MWWISCTFLKQETQYRSNILVIISLLYKASLVGKFSSNNLPKMVTFDGTLFNQKSLNTCTESGPVSGSLHMENKELRIELKPYSSIYYSNPSLLCSDFHPKRVHSSASYCASHWKKKKIMFQNNRPFMFLM